MLQNTEESFTEEKMVNTIKYCQRSSKIKTKKYQLILGKEAIIVTLAKAVPLECGINR